jgi:transcriptional regulator with XRE-family HTH domain
MAGRPKLTPDDNGFYRDLGRAIRLARVAAGKTQVDLADHLGVSFQQIQKYESGSNRIPVEELVTTAAYLDIPLSELLALPDRAAALVSLSDRLQPNGFQALLESWTEIKDQPMRAAILNLIKRAAALSR